MRKRNVVAFVALAALTAAAAWASDITGTWTGETDQGFSLSFAFKQDGTKLTGTVQGPQGDPIAISDGKVEGDKVSFTVTIEANGGMKISHEGTINGNEIKLSTKSDNADFQPGPMVLKKVK
jgi:hypothetical protein